MTWAREVELLRYQDHQPELLVYVRRLSRELTPRGTVSY